MRAKIRYFACMAPLSIPSQCHSFTSAAHSVGRLVSIRLKDKYRLKGKHVERGGGVERGEQKMPLSLGTTQAWLMDLGSRRGIWEQQRSCVNICHSTELGHLTEQFCSHAAPLLSFSFIYFPSVLRGKKKRKLTLFVVLFLLRKTKHPSSCFRTTANKIRHHHLGFSLAGAPCKHAR